MYIYRKDGQREETFPRREWNRVKFPHTVRVDVAGRVWAAGLMMWPWDDGVYGPVLKALNESMTPPVRARACHAQGEGGGGGVRAACVGRGALPARALVPSVGHMPHRPHSPAPHSHHPPACLLACPPAPVPAGPPLTQTAIEVYGLTSDASSRNSPFVREQRERWFEQHAGQEPSREMLASTGTRYALLPMATFPFPFTCAWPLFDLTGDGHLIAACYDSDELVVYRAYDEGGAPPARDAAASALGDAPAAGWELRDSLQEVARIARPYGIEAIGALTMDPSGRAFALLDRTRKRVYAAAWPLREDELRGTAAAPADRTVTGIKWHSDA